MLQDTGGADDHILVGAEPRGEGDGLRTELDVQDRVDEGRLGHPVAAPRREGTAERGDGEVAGREQGWAQERGDDLPGAAVPLRAEVGLDVGDALAPALGLVRLDADEDAFLPRGDAHRRPEGTDERQPDEAELEPADGRHTVPSAGRANRYAERVRSNAIPTSPRPMAASAASATSSRHRRAPSGSFSRRS